MLPDLLEHAFLFSEAKQELEKDVDFEFSGSGYLQLLFSLCDVA